MTKSESLTASAIGTIYAFSISSVISIIGNLMFSEFISFPFFLLITLIPSIGAFGILLYLKIRKGNLVCLFVLGFFISFLSMFIALFLDNIFKEEIYWSLLDVESFKWFLAFAMIGTILFIPISFVFIKISLKYFSVESKYD